MNSYFTKVNSFNFLALFLLLFFPELLFAQRTIILTDSTKAFPIGKFTQVFIDTHHNLNIDSVSSGTESNKFKQLNSNETDFGHTKDDIWIRFALKNETTHSVQWVVSQDFPIIDKVEFYDPLPGNKYKVLKAGTSFPLSSRKIKNRKIAFPFKLNKGETKTFYFRFSSSITLPVYLKIWTPTALTTGEANENFIYGIFYGALLIMALYNIFLFFFIKDSSFLYYALYAISLCYYQTCIDGFAFRYFTPENTWINGHIFIILIGLSSLLWLLFVRDFLQIPKYSSGYEKVYKAAITVSIIYSVMLAPFNIRTAALISFIPIEGSLVVTLSSVVYCLLKGNRNARILLVAMVAFVAGVLLIHLNSVDAVHGSRWGELSLQLGVFGVSLQMIFLSLALGNRVNTIKLEKEKEKAFIRSRIAKDLHDEIGSNLSSISLSSQMMKSNSKLEADEKLQLEDITQTAKETADSIREIIWFIDPENDEKEDLILKMRNAASKLLQKQSYTFNADDNKIKIPGDLQLRRNLFLIFKELLNNIVKHSYAKQVDIAIKNESGILNLSISDDGNGFDENKVKYGYGIKNIKERLKEMGGTLELNSSPGKGTNANIYLKISKAK